MAIKLPRPTACPQHLTATQSVALPPSLSRLTFRAVRFSQFTFCFSRFFVSVSLPFFVFAGFAFCFIYSRFFGCVCKRYQNKSNCCACASSCLCACVCECWCGSFLSHCRCCCCYWPPSGCVPEFCNIPRCQFDAKNFTQQQAKQTTTTATTTTAATNFWHLIGKLNLTLLQCSSSSNRSSSLSSSCTRGVYAMCAQSEAICGAINAHLSLSQVIFAHNIFKIFATQHPPLHSPTSYPCCPLSTRAVDVSSGALLPRLASAILRNDSKFI